jgi:hypothetical protein
MPTTGLVAGDEFRNTTTGTWYKHTGSAWHTLGALSYAIASTSVTAAVGQWIQVGGTTGAVTISLPTNGTAGDIVAITNDSSNPVTVAATGGESFDGGGLVSGPTSFPLGVGGGSAASVVLCFSGTRWIFLAGQQDSGWVALSLVNSWVSTGGPTPSVRLVGDRVWFKGSVSSGSTTTVATLGATYRPSSLVNLGATGANVNGAFVSTGGVVTALSTAYVLALEGFNYSLT